MLRLLMRFSFYGSMSAVAWMASGAAWAQIVPPSSTQPSQVQQHIQAEEPRPVLGQPAPYAMPETSPAQPTPKKTISFILNDVQFENLSVFTPQELKSEYSADLGQSIDFAELNAIVSRITLRYRNAGYILSRATIAPQAIENGIVKIQITEGYIAKVNFVGKKDKLGLLEKYAEEIRQVRPITIQSLERYLLLMDDLPGISTHATLSPDSDTPGAADIEIAVVEKHIDGNVSLDNRGTRYMGPVQGGVTLGLNNAFGAYDRTQFHGVGTAEFNELRYGQVSHEEPLDDQGTKLLVTAGYTRTHPTYTLSELEIEGTDTVFTGAVSHPFIRSRDMNLYGNVEFGYHDTKVDALGTELYDDKLWVLRAGGSYDFIDRFAASDTFGFTVSKGFDFADNDPNNSSKADGKPDFVKFNAEASRLTNLTGPIDLYLAANGQYAPDSLLISEQFGIGGSGFGSAYDPSEIIGDSGAAARAELRYTRGDDIRFIPSYQLYSFYDAGKVWSSNSLVGQKDSSSLTDAGLGLRFNALASISGSMELAFPLTKDVAANGDDGDRPRFFFALSKSF